MKASNNCPRLLNNQCAVCVSRRNQQIRTKISFPQVDDKMYVLCYVCIRVCVCVCVCCSVCVCVMFVCVSVRLSVCMYSRCELCV